MCHMVRAHIVHISIISIYFCTFPAWQIPKAARCGRWNFRAKGPQAVESHGLKLDNDRFQTSIEMSWTDTVRRFRPSDLFQQSFSCLRSIKIQIVDSTQTLDSSLVTNHYSLNINAINRYNKSIQVFDHHHRSSAIPPENKINSGSTKRQQLMQPMAKHLAIKPPNHSTVANPTQNKSHHPSWNQTYITLAVSEDSPNCQTPKFLQAPGCVLYQIRSVSVSSFCVFKNILAIHRHDKLG